MFHHRSAEAWEAPVPHCRTARRALWGTAATAAAIALAALVRRWHEAGAPAGEVVMVAPAAIGLLLAAGALLLAGPPRGPAATALGGAAALATAALGLVVVVHHLVEWRHGYPRSPFLGHHAWWALKPSPTTGLGLFLLGTSLTSLALPRLRRWAGATAAAALVVAVTALVGHAYGASALYARNPWGGTAISTAVAIGAVSVGVLLADPTRGVAAVLLSEGPGGRTLRRLLPATLLAPLLLGWLALAAQRAHLFDAVFAAAVLVVSLIVLPVAYIVRQAKAVHAFDTERERLLASERAARAAFFAMDRHWRFTYVNREAERLLKRPRDQLLGRSHWEVFPGPAGESFRRQYQRAMAERRTVHFEQYYAPESRWVDLRVYPQADGLSVYFHDITARKLAEERLRESEERYRLLADMIPQHIWTTGPDGYHSYFSRRWYEYTGTTPGQTQGDGRMRLLHPEDRERTRARWKHALETGEPYVIEYRFRRCDGNYTWFLGQAVPLRNEAGEIVEWFGTLTDISERKRLEEELERLLQKEQEARAEAERRRAELERVTESRARLMRGFSHDVRNPLNVADMQAWMLENGRPFGELAGPQRESVLRIRRSLRTAIGLIDDLLELSRAEAGQLDLVLVETDVGRLVHEVVEDFRAPAGAVDMVLQAQAPPGAQVKTDPARIRQVLANLLSNAVKYAPGSRVTVAARPDAPGGPGPGSWLALSVQDTGPSIAPDQRDLVFQEYTRLDPGAQPGARIGLAISRRIARLLGGDLTLEREVGRGCTFTLWLPAASGG